MTEIRYEPFQGGQRTAIFCADFLKSGCAKQIRSDAIEDNRSSESPLFDGAAFGYPTKSATENFARSPDALVSIRSGFKEVNGVATIGMADVVIEGCMSVHAATIAQKIVLLAPSWGQFYGWKIQPVSKGILVYPSDTVIENEP